MMIKVSVKKVKLVFDKEHNASVIGCSNADFLSAVVSLERRHIPPHKIRSVQRSDIVKTKGIIMPLFPPFS